MFYFCILEFGVIFADLCYDFAPVEMRDCRGAIHKGRTPDPVFEVLFRLYDCNLLTFSAEGLEVSKLNLRDHFYIFFGG